MTQIRSDKPFFTYEIPGDPIPLPRPRMGKYGVYNPVSQAKKAHQMLLNRQQAMHHEEFEKFPSLFFHDNPMPQKDKDGLSPTMADETIKGGASYSLHTDQTTLVNKFFSKEKHIPISLTLHFFFGKRGSSGEPHTTKPDIDNLVKYTMDVANTVLFHDDCQVIELHSYKHYGEPKTIIELSFPENHQTNS